MFEILQVAATTTTNSAFSIDITALLTGMAALIGAAGAVAASVLNFLRTQKHSTRIDAALDKASEVNAEVVGLTKTVEASKDKIETVLDVAGKVNPVLEEKHNQNKAQIEALTKQFNDVKAQLDRLSALTNAGVTTQAPPSPRIVGGSTTD